MGSPSAVPRSRLRCWAGPAWVSGTGSQQVQWVSCGAGGLLGLPGFPVQESNKSLTRRMMRKDHNTLCKIVLQSYSDKSHVVLASKWTGRPMEQNGRHWEKKKTHRTNHLIFHKGINICIREKIAFLKNCCRKNQISICSKMKLDLYLSP